ncbi:hypothetical protein PsorP6_004216 [Peronosclerospora sorghi]|uniref:Uncharacterized protein n=1 Tax=Peronosclerospora sorghi TaxID=230839 RepID=A0ACC0VPC7_9STRA|nr:hypothetical protein PsorP6_004216 [Peronosclerospora sorghi]
MTTRTRRLLLCQLHPRPSLHLQRSVIFSRMDAGEGEEPEEEFEAQFDPLNELDLEVYYDTLCRLKHRGDRCLLCLARLISR